MIILCAFGQILAAEWLHVTFEIHWFISVQSFQEHCLACVSEHRSRDNRINAKNTFDDSMSLLLDIVCTVCQSNWAEVSINVFIIIIVVVIRLMFHTEAINSNLSSSTRRLLVLWPSYSSDIISASSFSIVTHVFWPYNTKTRHHELGRRMCTTRWFKRQWRRSCIACLLQQNTYLWHS